MVYRAETTLATSQYNVAPFQKIPLSLTNIDRTNGDFHPEYEGNSLLFTRVDFPVLVSFVNAQTLAVQAFMATPGLRIDAPFKGITFTHPILTVNTYPMILEFTLGKACASIDNTQANPYSALYPPYAITIDGALSGQINVYLPPGARFIAEISLYTTATTVAGGHYQFFTVNGVAIGCPAIVGFPVAGQARGGLLAVLAEGGVGQFTAVNLPIPSGAAYLQMTTTGTALSLAGIAAVKALFQ